MRLHDDQIPSDPGLVRRLLAAQRPEWADRPVRRVDSTGTDNALFRLGDDLVARLPLRPSSTGPIEREHRWLPVLAPRLPLPIPVPLALGEPSDEFPFPWSVYPWLAGDDATVAPLDPARAARDLGRFVAALHAVDGLDAGPRPSAANYGRGVPLAERDRSTRHSTAEAAAAGLADGPAVTAVWDEALAAPPWDGPPVWLHGDIAAGNLLVRDGRIAAVIDWGTMGVGDPACDLTVAWELFAGADREAFRAEVGVDDATWLRGRGWAVSTAIGALPYYQHTNPFMADQARRKIAALVGAAS